VKRPFERALNRCQQSRRDCGALYAASITTSNSAPFTAASAARMGSRSESIELSTIWVGAIQRLRAGLSEADIDVEDFYTPPWLSVRLLAPLTPSYCYHFGI